MSLSKTRVIYKCCANPPISSDHHHPLIRQQIACKSCTFICDCTWRELGFKLSSIQFEKEETKEFTSIQLILTLIKVYSFNKLTALSHCIKFVAFTIQNKETAGKRSCFSRCSPFYQSVCVSACVLKIAEILLRQQASHNPPVIISWGRNICTRITVHC